MVSGDTVWYPTTRMPTILSPVAVGVGAAGGVSGATIPGGAGTTGRDGAGVGRGAGGSWPRAMPTATAAAASHAATSGPDRNPLPALGDRLALARRDTQPFGTDSDLDRFHAL